MSEFARIARKLESNLDLIFDMVDGLLGEITSGPTSTKLSVEEAKRLYSKCAEIDLHVRWSKACFSALWEEHDKETRK